MCEGSKNVNSENERSVGIKNGVRDGESINKNMNKDTLKDIHKSVVDNPYTVLGVDRSSSLEKINKAYTKLRLKYHPDRKTGNRVMYDKVVEAYNKILTLPAHQYVEVDKFIKEYKDSEEEKEDLVDLYLKYKGDISKIINHHLLSEDKDEERLRNILDKEIALRELEEFKKYKRKCKRKKRESKKAEKLAEELGIDLNQSLEDILNRKDEKRSNFLEDLETKYCRRLN